MTYKFDIAVLTDSRYVNPPMIDDYIQNILNEDQMVVDALESKGLKVIRVDWSNQQFDWTSVKTAIFRTTWDYFDRFDEFMQWLQSVKDHLEFINPIDLVLWNLDKHYLLDLQKKGISIPETYFVERGSILSLKEVVSGKSWDDFILKPAVSGAARHTYKINKGNIDQYEQVFKDLVAAESMLIQPFLTSVLSEGEVALMYFGRKYSHAIRKIAKPGDFRVQDDFGGTVHHYTPTQQEIALGEEAILACDPQPVYARVDLINDNNGQAAISELELIEPELWFRFKPEAANALADAIITHINH